MGPAHQVVAGLVGAAHPTVSIQGWQGLRMGDESEDDMLDRYYQEELAHLKDLAEEFAAAHPALAPMLAGASADPDVARLFESTALQYALLREKIEDDIPEYIQHLARRVCPQFLRPVPAATIVAFSPKPSLIKSQTIAAGTQLASVPVEGAKCLFRTCSDIEIHPLELCDAAFGQPPGEAPAISLSLTLNGLSLADWLPRSLRLFLGGEYPAAADLYLLLRRHLQRIVIIPESGGRPVVLPPDLLHPAGFDGSEAVIPYPSHVFPGYRLIQEHFAIPHRFLFLDLKGWERWTERGNGSRFTVRFELAPFTLPTPRVKRESFVLFAAPSVNLFSTDAEPIILEHRKERYLIRPEGLLPDHAQVFSVDGVTGLGHGTGRGRSYRACELGPITAGEPSYLTSIAALPVRPGFDVHLSFRHHQEAASYAGETISVALTCTNGRLPEGLRLGDLREATASSPESATFANITPVTPAVMPAVATNLLWRLVSHQALNLQALARAENLREILEIYLFEDGSRDQHSLNANRKRIASIEEVTCISTDRLVRGRPIRGTDLRMRVNGDHFAGAGDLFLFGSVLDQFLAGFATLNTFTRLTISEVMKGGGIEWQPRLGEQPLL